MMPTGKSKGSADEAGDPKIRGATRRAQLVSIISKAEAPMTIADIVAATGWGESGVAYTAAKCAKSGLIKVRKEGFKNLYFVGNGLEPESEEAEVSVVKRKTRITSAKEVELVVAGVLVILGRNPASGRLRIVLEEM